MRLLLLLCLIRGGCLFAASCVWVACAEDDLSDLHAYVAEVRGRI